MIGTTMSTQSRKINKKLKMSESLTNYYVAGSNQLLRITEVRLKTVGRPKKLDCTPPDDQNQLLKAGVADFAKENRLYLDLIRNAGCDQMTNDGILEAVAEFTGWTEYSNWIRKSHKPDQDSESDKSMFKIPVWREAAVKIVHLRTSKNWSIPSIWAKFSLTREQISRTFAQA